MTATAVVYKPVKLKYSEWATHYSPVTDRLIKRKRMLLFTGATAEEWLELAKDFIVDGGRANSKFCMLQYEKRSGIKLETEPAEPEYKLPELPDEIYNWQEID